MIKREVESDTYGCCLQNLELREWENTGKDVMKREDYLVYGGRIRMALQRWIKVYNEWNSITFHMEMLAWDNNG